MPPEPRPYVYVADGSHAGMRWWVERVPDLTYPMVTTIGWCDGSYVSERTEMQDASPAKVRAWVDGVLTVGFPGAIYDLDDVSRLRRDEGCSF